MIIESSIDNDTTATKHILYIYIYSNIKNYENPSY